LLKEFVGVGTSMEGALQAALKTRKEAETFSLPVTVLVSGKGVDATEIASRRVREVRLVLELLLSHINGVEVMESRTLPKLKLSVFGKLRLCLRFLSRTL
jgi:hypothetical protein